MSSSSPALAGPTPGAVLASFTTPTTANLPVGLVASAAAYAAAIRAPATLRAYRSDWRAFEAWCLQHGLQTMPAEGSTVALYLASLADRGRKVSTIERALAALSHAHRAAGHPSPRGSTNVQLVRSGIRRCLSVAPVQKSALFPADLRAAFRSQPRGLLATRDRALLLLGFATALRRSNLVALNVEDLRFRGAGVEVLVRRSKTDQEGAGHRIGVPPGGHRETCPVRALLTWLRAAGIAAGPLFLPVDRHGHLGQERLSDKAVARAVKRAAATAGLEPEGYSAHSLRAGLITTASRAGKSIPTIQRQTGQRSIATVARYVREADLFIDNAAEGVGL